MKGKLTLKPREDLDPYSPEDLATVAAFIELNPYLDLS